MADRFNSVLAYLPYTIKRSLEILPNDVKTEIQEIRIKNGLPLSLVTSKDIIFPKESQNYSTNSQNIICTKEDLHQIFRAVCGYSVHSHTEEIKRGFITLKGGHRVGICGCGVYDKGNLSVIKDISSLNIRIARQVIGSANAIIHNFGKDIYSTLIAGSPGSGKTTILRDVARSLSNGSAYRYYRVFVADERYELSSSQDGIIQNDLGITVDVMCGINKIEALNIGIRCFSPEVIIVDEIGDEREAQMLFECFNSGVKIIATTHCRNKQELMNKKFISQLVKNGIFEKVVILKEGNQKGAIESIIDSGELS